MGGHILRRGIGQASIAAMARRYALAALTIGSVVILASSLSSGAAAEIAFVLAAAAFPALLMVVGAAGSGGRLGAAAWPIAGLLVALEACLFAMLLLRGQVEAGGWVLGLPAAAAVQIYGVLLLPQALVALGYALTFDSFGVSEPDLDRLRELARRPPAG